MDNLLDNEAVVRLSGFAVVFAAVALWELAVPRRRLNVRKPLRWASNLGLVALNTVAVRLIVPMGAVGMALLAEERGWGLFHQLAVPSWAGVLLGVIVLDLVIYLQHVMFHAIPVLWRLHMVHHADLDFDVSTGIRFHTLEILLSMGIKLTVVLLLAVPALGVLFFEVLLNATALFNHANARLPSWLDRLLRLVVVTPDMHRVHHSVLRQETNSNFGFNLPWWDFLFGTYRREPAAGHENMAIGLSQIRDEAQADRLWAMLALPFRGDPGQYPVNGERTPDRTPYPLESKDERIPEHSGSAGV